MLRPAQTGDYFLVARPTGEDEKDVHRLQSQIAAEVGGEPETYVHVTLQRFELKDSTREESIFDEMESAQRSCGRPDVVASSLFCTYHRFFKRYSLRWKIAATPELGRLTLQSAQCIMKSGGVSHWPNAEASIAQFMTAVWVDGETEVPPEVLDNYPQRLMTVSNLEITKVVGEQTFEILRRFSVA